MVLAEANKAFEFNNGLFRALKPPSNPPSPSPSPVHTLGDPTSPVEPSMSVLARVPKEKDGERPYPLQLPKEDEAGSGAYTTQGVLAFIAAMCLAHFVLVVGGFTGSRGWEKYVAVMGWIHRQRAQVGL
jgi:hypothetical protein